MYVHACTHTQGLYRTYYATCKQRNVHVCALCVCVCVRCRWHDKRIICLLKNVDTRWAQLIRHRLISEYMIGTIRARQKSQSKIE